eukprot:s223_g14.t1
MSRVDVLADDRGLNGCFQVANVKDEWAQAFVAKHKMVTLDDYIYALPSTEWEKGVESLVYQVPTLKDNLIALARFRSAFDIGKEALRQAAAPSAKSSDLDEPLPEATLKSLNQDWTRRYNLQLDPSLEPCEALRSRLYREFRKGQVTVIEAKKVKSVIAVAQPKTQGSVTLGDNLHLEFEKEEGVPLKSCIEYYLQLRVLAHEMAWAGNYQVDYEGGRHWMMDLTTALGYVDTALRNCVEFASSSMLWLQRNDILTRGKFATYVNRGMPGSVAMKQALQETHLEWRSPLALPLVSSAGSGHPGAAKRKSEDGPPPAGEPASRRPRALKGDAWPTVSMVSLQDWVDPPQGAACGAEAARLRAAKPVAWRGLGDLHQFSWARPTPGAWLVIDLWAGFSGLCIALLSMGTRFHALAAENDPFPAQVVDQLMPNVVAVDAVENVTGAMFRPFLQRRQVRGIVLGGGSPCQGNSALNSGRKGLADVRSQQPQQLVRIRAELQALPECQNLEIVTFLENVASMPADVQAQYTAWVGFPPIVIDAGACGWVQRRRLLWLGTGHRGVSPECPPPDGWVWIQSETGPPELRWQGPKPIPAKVIFDQNFLPLFDPAEVVKAAGRGAMHPFTREFWHPCDRVHLAPPAAAAKFYADNRRFPPSAYSDESLLWRHDEWRQPSPEERAQMMGFPAQCLSAVTGPAAVRRQRQNSMLGNGFHLPMIVALFCLLPGVLGTKVPRPLFDVDETALQERLAGTVWAPGRLQTFPGLLDSHQVLQITRTQIFPSVALAPDVWTLVQARLAPLPLWRLQAFTAWAVGRGLAADQLGPTPVTVRHRTGLFAGLSGQRHPGNSKKGLDHLLPPGLGREEHVRRALLLPSPFQLREWPELDVDFVLHAIATWQQSLVGYSEQCRRVFRQACVALQPLDDALSFFRSSSARKVATSKRPAVLAFLTALLRWPDLQQPLQMLTGYPIVGELEPSGVFRAVLGRDALPLDEWLGSAAVAAVDKIEASRPPRFADRIYEATVEEQEKSFCSPFHTRSALDAMFGRGMWRPLERFLIVQPDGKERVIDNARRTLHNSSTSMLETIYTVHLDFIPAVLKQLAHRLQVGSPADWSGRFPWAHFRLGTDDLPDAYRGLPVSEDHLPYSAVAVWVPQLGWRYTLLWGLAFGLESAVVSFNRLPQLAIAATRRCLYGLVAAYFDDELAIETIEASNVSQRGLQQMFCSIGAAPQASKSFCPTPDRHYLGAAIHLGSVADTGHVRIQPKFSTSAKVAARLQRAIAQRCLTKDEAGKLRGDLTWMFSLAAGHLGRLIQPVCGADRAPLVVYSDASFENDVLRLGWVVMCPGTSTQPQGGTCVVPDDVIASSLPRRQQIYPGEAVVALVLPALCPDLLRNRDILWFIDNESAASTLVRCVSSQCDVHEIAQYSHYLLNRLGARTWFEWIDSDSNPSDGLSRLGLDDEWTQTQGWSLTSHPFPPGLSRGEFLESLLEQNCTNYCVDCSWTDWSPWDICSVSCGGGTARRSRKINELKQGGGAQCRGESEESQPCNAQECPIDCEFSSWGDWSSCEPYCKGSQERHREVTTEAAFGGKSCYVLATEGALSNETVGVTSQTRACSNWCRDCSWLDWTPYSRCSASCGGGTKSRFRDQLFVLQSKKSGFEAASSKALYGYELKMNLKCDASSMRKEIMTLQAAREKCNADPDCGGAQLRK